jgi:hypothetical protein
VCLGNRWIYILSEDEIVVSICSIAVPTWDNGVVPAGGVAAQPPPTVAAAGGVATQPLAVLLPGPRQRGNHESLAVLLWPPPTVAPAGESPQRGILAAGGVALAPANSAVLGAEGDGVVRAPADSAVIGVDVDGVETAPPIVA